MCQILKVARCGYYKHIHRKTTARNDENQVLMAYIKDIFIEHKSRYEAGRIRNSLFKVGINISKKRVTKLMRAQGLYDKGARYKYKHHKRDLTVPSRNLINQNFNAIKKIRFDLEISHKFNFKKAPYTYRYSWTFSHEKS